MNYALILIYYAFMWLFTKKLGFVKLNKGGFWMMHAVIFVLIFFKVIFEGQYTPHSNKLFVQKYVVPISPEWGGLVDRVYVKDKQYVKAGDPLFKVNSDRFLSKMESSESSIDLMEVDLRTMDELVPVGGASKVDQEKQEIAIEKAKVNQERNKRRADYSLVRAPVDGQVMNLQLQEGIFIRMKMPVMTLVSNESKWAVAFIEQPGMGKVMAGDKIEMIYRMFPAQTFNGTVDSIISGSELSQFAPGGDLPNEYLNVGANKMMIKISLDNDDQNQQLDIGMSGRGVVFTKDAGNGLVFLRRVENMLQSYFSYFWVLADH